MYFHDTCKFGWTKCLFMCICLCFLDIPYCAQDLILTHTQGSVLKVLRGPYAVLGIKKLSAMHKASALLLYLQLCLPI